MFLACPLLGASRRFRYFRPRCLVEPYQVDAQSLYRYQMAAVHRRDRLAPYRNSIQRRRAAARGHRQGQGRGEIQGTQADRCVSRGTDQAMRAAGEKPAHVARRPGEARSSVYGCWRMGAPTAGRRTQCRQPVEWWHYLAHVLKSDASITTGSADIRGAKSIASRMSRRMSMPGATSVSASPAAVSRKTARSVM
jgi:hypothetical protein